MGFGNKEEQTGDTVPPPLAPAQQEIFENGTAASVDSAEDGLVKRKQKFRWRNFWICFAISLGQIAFGYPSSIISTTLGQPAFLLYHGLITPEGLPGNNSENLIGATSGVFQV
jgi:hypothetical protein